jgi:hypothetical protein
MTDTELQSSLNRKLNRFSLEVKRIEEFSRLSPTEFHPVLTRSSASKFIELLVTPILGFKRGRANSVSLIWLEVNGLSTLKLLETD